MRVIGGASRGRKLSARPPDGVRPTSDRVREAIFDILGSMGGVQELSVADLCCGTGALGIEALSRGAASVTFVDRSPEAIEAVRANLAAVGLADAPVRLVRGVVPGWLAGEHPFDLVLCDPPYEFDEWTALLEGLVADIAVLESAGPVDPPPRWVVQRERRYGGTLVTVVRPTYPPPAVAP